MDFGAGDFGIASVFLLLNLASGQTRLLKEKERGLSVKFQKSFEVRIMYLERTASEASSRVLCLEIVSSRIKEPSRKHFSKSSRFVNSCPTI